MISHNRNDIQDNSDAIKDFKVLEYPKVIKNLYRISKNGIVYSVINNNCISWSIRNGKPYVNLSCKDDNGNLLLEPFYIKDLVAYNYIADASSYLERGFHSVNIDGNSMNCNCSNIIYISSIS